MLRKQGYTNSYFTMNLFQVELSKVTHAFLLNNAGSLGDVSKCFKDVSQKVDALADYFNLNLNSPSFLT